MNLLENVQKDFLKLFGYTAKAMLNDLNMKSENMKSYIDMSQKIIETSERIVDDNNDFFKKFNEMKSTVGQLHSNSKGAAMTLKTAVKMAEVTLTVEKTVQIFEANGNSVENYIAWWGKNELTSLNTAFDNYSEMLALTA